MKQKRLLAEQIQMLIRSTGHPELPEGEITFNIHIKGAEPWSWAQIRNNGAVLEPGINPHNELVAEQQECEHEWVSTHNPPYIIGGEFCPKCNAVRKSQQESS